MSASTSSPKIAPADGEQYATFVRRAHQSLAGAIPDWEERNAAVWSAWERKNGHPVRNRAMKYHAKGCGRFVPDVCYFMEHETVGRDGKPVRYTFDELKDIADEQNARAEHHNYSAISDRHTSDRPVPKELEPEVVGYSGAARLGMVGDKWAIFMDEHHKRDGLKVLDKKQRRSVEINRYRDGRRPYFDPIAALGSESPRLPLPVARYSGEDDPELIERYSVEAPAMVSGSNSFIPVLGSKRDEDIQQYSDAEPDDMGITEQDVAAIVQALQNTPEMQWVKSQMTQGNPQAQQAGSQAAGQPGPTAPTNPGQPTGSPSPQPHAGAMMPQHQQPGQRYAANEDPELDLAEKYSVLNDQYLELNEKYSQVHEVNKDLMSKLAVNQQAIAQLEARAVDAERTERIKDLYQAHPHFVVLDEELDTCLYSRGSEMNNEAFEKHLASVENYAKRSSPVTRMVPGGALPAERYSAGADLGKLIVDRYTSYADTGVIKSYDEVKAEIEKELAAGKA